VKEKVTYRQHSVWRFPNYIFYTIYSPIT